MKSTCSAQQETTTTIPQIQAVYLRTNPAPDVPFNTKGAGALGSAGAV